MQDLIDHGLGGLARTKLSVAKLDRRGFVMTSLISGLTLATTRVEAQAIHTDSEGLVAGPVRIPVPDGFIPAYSARPAGTGPFPTVLVVEEIFGVHEYIKDICRRFAKLGYLAVAPELYARIGDLSKLSDVQQIFREVISKAPDAMLMTDLDHTAAWALENHADPTRLAITGFCWGGRTTWLYAGHNPDLKAAVAWYGPIGGKISELQPHTVAEEAKEIKCPLLGLYGGKDDGIPVEAVQEAAKSARAAGKSAEIVIYPEAGHAFFADYRPSYQPEAAADGWRRLQAFFHAHGV